MCDPKALKWVSALWHLLLQPVVLPLAPVVSASYCTLPSPRNVHFVSQNMKNVLHWLPPEGIVEDQLIYNVKYLIYGTAKWIKNLECINISRTWCDLSHGTRDHKELYHAKVKAFLNGSCSSWAESPRFNPLTDTKIGPPAFVMSSTEKSILVIVTPPEKWKRDPREQPLYLHQIYSDLQYNVSVFNTKVKKRWVFCIKNNRLDILQLESNTVYCVMVQVYVTPLLHSGFSKEHCIATLQDPTVKQTIIFGYILPALLITLIILASSCCVYRYIHVTKKKYPKTLVLKYSKRCERDSVVPPEKIVVNFITVNIVDQCKTTQEDAHLHGNANCYAGDCGERDVEEEPSEEPLEEKHSQGPCLNKDTLLRNEQDGTRPQMKGLQSHRTLGHSEETILYELNVRAEDTIPTQEEQNKLSLKVDIHTPEELLHNLQKTPLHIVTNEIKQVCCPRFELPDTFSVQKLRELLWNEMNSATVDLQVPLINQLTVELDQAFFPKCGVGTDICLAPDQKEPFVDTVSRNSSYCPQFVTWAGQEQEAAEETEGEDEQSIIVDWDPQPGRLFLPSLSSLTNEVHGKMETKKYAESLEEGLLSRLYERQCSDEQLEEEEDVYLQHLKEQWGLHIQMETQPFPLSLSQFKFPF